MTNISGDECVAMQYVFANEDKKTFLECSDAERAEIIKAKVYDRCEVCQKVIDTWVKTETNDIIYIGSIYRALKPAPTPNEIDWSQFPAWGKSCATDADGRTYLYEAIATWRASSWDPKHMKVVDITDFPGFKRGKVAPENSLLIKPEGK